MQGSSELEISESDSSEFHVQSQSITPSLEMAGPLFLHLFSQSTGYSKPRMKTNTKIFEEVSFFLGEISPEKTGENNFIKESFIEVYLGMIV